MKKLQLLVREKQWFGQKHVFLRVLGFYFFKELNTEFTMIFEKFD